MHSFCIMHISMDFLKILPHIERAPRALGGLAQGREQQRAEMMSQQQSSWQLRAGQPSCLAPTLPYFPSHWLTFPPWFVTLPEVYLE